MKIFECVWIRKCHKCGRESSGQNEDQLLDEGWLIPYFITLPDGAELQTELCPECELRELREARAESERRGRLLQKYAMHSMECRELVIRERQTGLTSPPCICGFDENVVPICQGIDALDESRRRARPPERCPHCGADKLRTDDDGIRLPETVFDCDTRWSRHGLERGTRCFISIQPAVAVDSSGDTAPSVEVQAQMLEEIYRECIASFSQVICTPEAGYMKTSGGFSWLLSDIRKVADIAAGKRKPDFPLEPQPISTDSTHAGPLAGAGAILLPEPDKYGRHIFPDGSIVGNCNPGNEWKWYARLICGSIMRQFFESPEAAAQALAELGEGPCSMEGWKANA